LYPTTTCRKIRRSIAGCILPELKRTTLAKTNRVQAILDGRGAKKTRKVKEQFAFSGPITCGHCGCAMVGEIKKGRYIYYHCTGFKGKCPEPCTRETCLGVSGREAAWRQFSPMLTDWWLVAIRLYPSEILQSCIDKVRRLRAHSMTVGHIFIEGRMH
jgi:hypothetical protein